MSKRKFHWVENVVAWRPFRLDNEIFDLQHLDAFEHIYENDKDGRQYKFIVTFSHHCFTKDLEHLTPGDKARLMYPSPKDQRPFNFERYELSKFLPEIVRGFDSKSTVIFHAGYGSFAVMELPDAQQEYLVVFSAFKERKRLRLHITSAYPLDEKLGRVKKVGFFVIASNTLMGKKIKRPN